VRGLRCAKERAPRTEDRAPVFNMKTKLTNIKVLALDVDGVLTNGQIIYDSAGKETKVFDVQDGYGIVLLQRNGIKTAIISAREAKPVSIRAKDLGIHKVYQNAYPKIDAYKRMLKDFKVKDAEVCFVGDDLPDLPVLKRVGFAVAVKNACVDVRKSADYVTKNKGGRGAVREVAELILKAQGKWQRILKNL
jgi:3-deoxy-D-manno-octulosonate 8-phosphate phosphatase (KDO 8-P phosphatase)